MQKSSKNGLVEMLVSLKELRVFAKELAENAGGGEIFALIGDLGAGKTAFAKAFLKARGIRKKITSPTFSLVIPYVSKKTNYFHADLYRIGSLKEFNALGIPEQWGKKENIFLIEWADKIAKVLPKNTLTIRLKKIPGAKFRNYRSVSLGRQKKDKFLK